jgi:hypothetical protein
MTAKSASERMAAMRQRREALGFTRLELWAHPQDHDALKRRAEQLQRKREKEKK